MRLVDADEFLVEASKHIDMQDLYLPSHIKDMAIDEMSTIDAIPISFLQDKIALAEAWGLYGYAKGLQSAIDEWNGRKKE